jgi:arabinose-5-phosphate isomerase
MSERRAVETVKSNALDEARRVLRTEAAAILSLVDRLGEPFERAVAMLDACRGQGRVIVTGLGKSGIICRKIAATLSSTGTSAFYLHPTEAIHGDLGVVRREDLVVALSYSGETEEILRLIEAIRRIGARLVAITGAPASTLGRVADVTLECGVSAEACPLNLVPTASTTAALALGDALAMALWIRKGFSEDDFASVHPGGELGRRLMRVEHVMHSGDEIPRVLVDTPMKDVVHEMSSKRLGMTCVTDGDGRLVGVITDGDLRRHWDAGIRDSTAGAVMTPRPVTIRRSLLAVEALRIMEERKITSVIVVGDGDAIEGVVQVHDLWRTQMF